MSMQDNDKARSRRNWAILVALVSNGWTTALLVLAKELARGV